jgi:PDZ domain
LLPTLRAPLCAVALCTLPLAAPAQTLPAPYVSRAVDAVLLPVDDAVIEAFGLGSEEYGALILAVQPGGIAEAAGLQPGDVIALVQGETIEEPVDVDAVVYYWLQQGTKEFTFDIWQAGAPVATAWVITQASYAEVIEITSVETWVSYSYESFSYAEFYAEYSVEISESYEYSETTIETMVTSEEFTSEMTSEETSEEVTEEVTEETAEETTEESVDESTDESADESVDESADEGVDEEPVEEDAAEEDVAEEDVAEEEPADEGGDEGGDDAVEE